MRLKDLLSEEEIEKYHDEWNSFSKKYKPETPCNVHSGLPIIGQVFQFEGKPIFRAHIFKRKLKKAFDPYFTSKNGYFLPFFHISHYFFPIEQSVNSTLSKLVPNYQGYVITDRFDNKKTVVIEKKVYFKRATTSIELLPVLIFGKNRFAIKGSATFYEDMTNELLQIWYFKGFGMLRNYVKNIQRLKKEIILQLKIWLGKLKIEL